MPEKITIIDPVADPGWDRFVESHPLGMIYHLSGWKQVLEANFHHIKGHNLALTDEASGVIRAAMPLYEVRSWLTGKRLVSIPYASVCDPLVSSSADFATLFEAALELSRTLGIARVEIRTYKSLKMVENARLGRSGLYKLHYLPLEQGPGQLWKNFHRSCIRQKISRAISSEMSLKVVESKADMEAFYRLYVMTRKRLCLPPQPRSFLESLWEVFSPTKRISVLLGLKDGKPISGLLLLKFQDRVSAEYGVSDKAYWDLNPNHFLFWEAIQSACREGGKVFDFGRTSPRNQELIDFKERWGPCADDLVEFSSPCLGPHESVMRENSTPYRLAKGLLQYVPEPVFERLGGYCYRHMG